MPAAPIAPRVPHELRHHDRVRVDPYYWLRDDERTRPEVLDYLRAENAYTDAILQPLSSLRQELFDEIVARLPSEDASVPVLIDGYWYYRRLEPGHEYGIHCRKRGDLDASEEIILDENVQARPHAFYALGAFEVSTNTRWMAFTEDTLSRRIYTLGFRDLTTGKDTDDVVEGTTGAVVWALDDRTVFYVRRDPDTLRAHQVWRHELGTPAGSDVLVYEETDEEFYVNIYRSRSRDFVFIGSHHTVTDEYRVVDAHAPRSEPRLVFGRERDHEYTVDHALGRFFIRTNWQARDFRLMSVAPEHSQDRAAWQEEIPARDGILLRGFELFSNHLVVSERRDGLARLRVIPWNDRAAEHELSFPQRAFMADFGVNTRFDTPTLRFEYTSMTTPPSVFDYDMNTRATTLLKREPVGGDFDPTDYVTERITLPARDGTAIPVSIVHRADLDRSRPQPLLLYGYGSYGLSLDPTFSSPRLSLLDRGVIYAIAHVRGGQELGRAWYEDGKLLHKIHTFHDFIDCAQALVDAGWTAPDRLFAHGGSAGGLLVGAVANMRPDLFEAIVADVPFVDVVTTMLDPSIPLTTFEYDEWGNPADPTFFEYMLRYSPYDNVAAHDYPHMLVLTGLHDSQVQYWEPAKWVARLRALKTDQHDLLFSVDMEAGHGGPSGRFRRHEETALIYAFLLDHVPR